MTDDTLEPWQWPERQWRKIVNHVRAGRTLRPTSWPGGARCAVALSFDSDHETNEAIVFGYLVAWFLGEVS